MARLDNIDIQITNMLIDDARIPYQEIAEACELSRATIHQRIQKLVALGVLKGSGYKVDYAKLGNNTFAYIGIGLEKGSYYDSVSKALEEIPEIVECNFTTGPYDMLVKLYARDNRHLLDILDDQIRQIPGVQQTETFLSLKYTIDRPFYLQPIKGKLEVQKD